MASAVKVEGLAELNSTLKKLADKASQEQIRTALQAGALVIREAAKVRAPILTGTLRRSLAYRTFINGGAAQARIGTNLEYAAHVEFGTSRQPAQPYLRTAYDEKKGEAIDEITAVLQELTTP